MRVVAGVAVVQVVPPSWVTSTRWAPPGQVPGQGHARRAGGRGGHEQRPGHGRVPGVDAGPQQAAEVRAVSRTVADTAVVVVVPVVVVVVVVVDSAQVAALSVGAGPGASNAHRRGHGRRS
ncbi:hypothetical protein NUM3379_00960 [Kineococcus sp. NUM-3379]